MSTEHELKTWPAFYDAMLSGDKPFEARFNDRSFQKGDTLHLREWNPDTKEYTGRSCHKRVTYILSGWGVQAGHVVMGLRDIPECKHLRTRATDPASNGGFMVQCVLCGASKKGNGEWVSK